MCTIIEIVTLHIHYFNMLQFAFCVSQIWSVLSTAFHPDRTHSDFLRQQEESWICTICPQCQNLTAVSMYPLSRSWHYQEPFNCRSGVNMFTAFFSVNREMGPALRLQSNVEPLKTKNNAALGRLAASFGLSALQNKREVPRRQMDKGKKISVKTSSHYSGPPASPN